MPIPYSQFIIGQEEPDEMPNEVAYHLAGLSGCHHKVAHRALVKLNPEISFNAWGAAMLRFEDIGPVAAEIATVYHAYAVACRQASKKHLTFRDVAPQSWLRDLGR